MTLRKRGYLEESVEPFPRWKSGPVETLRQLKDKHVNDPGFVKLMASLGLDPDDPPPPEKKRTCPKCGSRKLVVRERHPDTDINYMEHRCLACGYRKEI